MYFSQAQVQTHKKKTIHIKKEKCDLLGHACSSPPRPLFDKTEETKQQNRHFPQQHQALFGRKRSPSPSMHPKSIILIPYMQPMFHQKKIAAIVPLDLGLDLCPQPWQKSKGAAAWGLLAETGHLPGSNQACLKGMLK
jgi:hypothetical protein